MPKKKKKILRKKLAKKIIKKTVKKLVKKPKKFLDKKNRVVKKKKTVARKIVRKRVQPSRKKTTVPELKTSFSAESFFKAKIKVIGIGGGGGSIVSEIGRALHKATFVVADTDVRAFKKRQGIKYFLFGQKLTHGLGTGVNPELGRQAALEEKEKITHFFDQQDIVIFIASLGGGLGSGATQVFAEAAKDFNGITMGIFTLPFKFEGKNKYKIALKSLKELRKCLNVSITIPNEKIFKIIDANTAITDAFSMVNKNLIESLESLIDLIYSPGIINIDFADLRAILNGKGSLAFLNTAEASGKNRADDIAQKILHNPLYQSNNFAAEKILFNIAGGGNLGMVEVDKISRKISEQNPGAKIIFGISKDTSLKNKIKTTLLMTGASDEPKIIAQPKPVIIKKIVPAAKKPKVIKKKIQKVEKVSAYNKVLEDKKEKMPVREVEKNPVITNLPVAGQTPMVVAQKLDIEELDVKPKKAIRRSALEIKKAEELEEKKQSLQEKEWEIPAFLRLKK